MRIKRRTVFSFLPGYAHRVVGLYINIVVGIFEGHERFPAISIPVPYEKHGRILIAPVAFVKLQNRTHTNGEMASIDRPG